MIREHYTIDLHTHSIYSKDGAITEEHYTYVLERGILDYIAVTDHDRIDFALSIQKKLGERIIVGEEVRTKEGEVIGLFLNKAVPPGLSLGETIRLIQAQDGIVYLPHPFCHNRSGVTQSDVEAVIEDIDIIESFNPRNIIHSDNVVAEKFAVDYRKPEAVSSDAHCVGELGRTYTRISSTPSKDALLSLISKGVHAVQYTTPWHLLCPKKNRVMKLFSIQ